MAAELQAVLAALAPRLGTPGGDPAPLDGGITNRNFRVPFDGRECVVRLPGPGTDLLGIDRDTERAATAAAAAAGIGPDVVAHLPEPACLVTGFIAGTVLEPEAVREPGVLEEVAGGLRAFHAGPPLSTRFDAFETAERYAEIVRARGGALFAGHAELARRVGAIRAAMAGPEHAPVPCHNDLLPANLIHDGTRVRIVDWEYAGTGDRYFDFGNLSVNCGFAEDDDARLLAAYWEEPCTPRRFAAVRLMRIVSDFREAMWGAVQAVVSQLAFDFAAYAEEHAERVRAALGDARVERWLRDARGAP